MVNPHTVEFNTTSTSRAAAWFQEYITIKLINHAWWLQNVFITFMPVSGIRHSSVTTVARILIAIAKQELVLHYV